MPSAKKISIIVPVYNEEMTVADVIQRLYDADTRGWEKEIIIVDDGSRDASRRVLQESSHAGNLTVIVHDTNQGKGAAIRAGLAHARGDAVLIQDADLEYNPADIADLLTAFDHHGGKAVVYGSRELAPERKGYPHYVLGVRFLTMLTNISFGSSLTDIYTGYKLFPASVIKNMPIVSAGFEFEAEVTARLLGAGIAIVEVPIRYNPRTFKEGKKIGIRDGIRGALTILKYSKGTMNLLNRVSPEMPLRVGFGLMYFYSGYDLIVNPAHWYGFVPQWFLGIVDIFLSQDVYLRLQGAGEFVMGLALLSWFLPRGIVRVVSLLAIVEMTGILFLAGIDTITFRDLGLLGGAVALFFLVIRQRGAGI